MDKQEEKPHSWKDADGVHVEVDFTEPENEQAETVHFGESEQELRVERVAKLYYYERKTIREIATLEGISKSQIHNDLKRFIQDASRIIRADVKFNKRALGLLAGLQTQANERIKILLQEHQRLGGYLEILGEAVRSGLMNPEVNAQNLNEPLREVRLLIDGRNRILCQLRNEGLGLLQVYSVFGLCGTESTDLLVGGEGEIKSRIEEVKILVSRMFHIIRDEVSDEKAQSNIFNRLANEIRDGVLDNWKRGDEDGVNPA